MYSPNSCGQRATSLVLCSLAVLISASARGEITKGTRVFLDDAFADNATLLEGPWPNFDPGLLHSPPNDADLDDYLVGDDVGKGVSYFEATPAIVIQLDFVNPITNREGEDLVVFEWGGTPDRFALAVGDGTTFSEFRNYQPQYEFDEGGHEINPAGIELSDFASLPPTLNSIRITVPGPSVYPDIAGAATVPEPTALLLFALGTFAMVSRRGVR